MIETQTMGFVRTADLRFKHFTQGGMDHNRLFGRIEGGLVPDHEDCADTACTITERTRPEPFQTARSVNLGKDRHGRRFAAPERGHVICETFHGFAVYANGCQLLACAGEFHCPHAKAILNARHGVDRRDVVTETQKNFALAVQSRPGFAATHFSIGRKPHPFKEIY